AAAGVYEDEWADAARAALGLTDTATVVGVAAGSPAEAAGLERGDRILAVGGQPVPVGRDAVGSARDLIALAVSDSVHLQVRRGAQIVEKRIVPVKACDFETVVTA